MKYIRHYTGVYGKGTFEIKVVFDWDDGDKDRWESSRPEALNDPIQFYLDKWNSDENMEAVEEVSKEEYLANQVVNS